jgi:hypothetical protein
VGDQPWVILSASVSQIPAEPFGMMVARDGVEWNYVPLDGLTLYPNLLNTEHPAA